MSTRSVVYAVFVPEGDDLYLPYPGSLPMGSQEAAEHIAKPNAHLGWKVVPCTIEPIEDECPHDWVSHGFNPHYGQIYECRICEGRTP